jgi:exosortase A-associated hydrolase 1
VAILNFQEHALTFESDGETLVGVLATPARSGPVGTLIIVGGPQYRVGSHRQFLLLARALASKGVPTFRFDCRGMGDSSGSMRSFGDIGPDIRAAIETFREHCPEVDRIVLWGLCDAASAAVLYWHATRDPRIAGMVLLNPWVRSDASLAKTHIKHYYVQRLLEREFWIKLGGGKVDFLGATREFMRNLALARNAYDSSSTGKATDFRDRMAEGMRSFKGPVLLMLSGRDLTAKEFLEHVQGHPRWSGLLESAGVVRHDLPEADHTFSSARWARDVETRTLRWLTQSFS